MSAINADAHAAEAEEGSALALLKSWRARLVGTTQQDSSATKSPMLDTGVHMAMAMADGGDNTMLTSLTRRPKEWHFTFHAGGMDHG